MCPIRTYFSRIALFVRNNIKSLLPTKFIFPMTKHYGNVAAVCNLYETLTYGALIWNKLNIKVRPKPFFDILLIAQSNQSCFEQADLFPWSSMQHLCNRMKQIMKQLFGKWLNCKCGRLLISTSHIVNCTKQSKLLRANWFLPIKLMQHSCKRMKQFMEQ